MSTPATCHCVEPTAERQALARTRNDTRTSAAGTPDGQTAGRDVGLFGGRVATVDTVPPLRTMRVLHAQRVFGNLAAQRVVQRFAAPPAANEPLQGMRAERVESAYAESDPTATTKQRWSVAPPEPPLQPDVSATRLEASVEAPALGSLTDDGVTALAKEVPAREGLGHPVATAPVAREKPAKLPGAGDGGIAKGAESPLKAVATAQTQLINLDAARSEAEVSRIAASHQKHVSGHFGGMRRAFSEFFAQSIAGVQQLIAAKQAEISAAASGALKSTQALVASTLQAARAQGNEVRETIDGVVKEVTASLQDRVRGITEQITGVIDRVSIPDLPGAAQLRDTARNLVRQASGAVTGGLDQVRALIGAALAAGTRLLASMLDVFQRLVDGALSQAATAIQRLVQLIGRVLNQVVTLVVSALRKVLSATILPMVDRVERAITQAIDKARQQALTAIRSNRDEHLRALDLVVRPSAAGAGAAGTPAPTGNGNAADPASTLREIARESIEANRLVVTLFEGRISSVLGSIFQAVASAAGQITGRIASAIAQAVQIVTAKVTEVVQGFGQIAQAVMGFIQSVLQALTGALRSIVQYVRALVQNPVDQLLQFAQATLRRIGEAIGRLIRNVIDSITGAAPAQEAPQFAPTRNFLPAPAFVGPALPVVIYILTVIVTILGGTIVVIGGTVMIIIGGSVFFVSTTTLVIIAVVIALLLLILLVYLLYRWTKPKPKPKPPPGCTPTPPVPFPPGSAVLNGPVAPSIPLDPCDYGLTFPESVNATISARCDGTQWFAVLTGLTGNYSEQVRLLPGQTEVTGPAGNTRQGNFCAQVTELNDLGHCPGVWYMISAVQAHEDVHLSRFHPALVFKAPVIESAITPLSVPDAPGKTPPQAAAEIAALPAFPAALVQAQQDWLADVLVRVRHDHDPGGPCDTAEHAVVDPMVTSICAHAKASAWGPCPPVCPP